MFAAHCEHKGSTQNNGLFTFPQLVSFSTRSRSAAWYISKVLLNNLPFSIILAKQQVVWDISSHIEQWGVPYGTKDVDTSFCSVLVCIHTFWKSVISHDSFQLKKAENSMYKYHAML